MAFDVNAFHEHQRIDLASLPVISQLDNDELIPQESLLFETLLFFGSFSKINTASHPLFASGNNNFRSFRCHHN